MSYPTRKAVTKLHLFFENGGQGTAKELGQKYSLEYYDIYQVMTQFKRYYANRSQSFGMVKPNGRDGIYKLLTVEEARAATERNLNHVKNVTKANLKPADVLIENDEESKAFVFGKINEDVKLLSSYLEKWSKPQLKGKDGNS